MSTHSNDHENMQEIGVTDGKLIVIMTTGFEKCKALPIWFL